MSDLPYPEIFVQIFLQKAIFVEDLQPPNLHKHISTHYFD